MNKIKLKNIGWILLINILFTFSYFCYKYYSDRIVIEGKIDKLFDGNSSICGHEFYTVYDMWRSHPSNAIRIYNLRRNDAFTFQYDWFECDKSNIKTKGSSINYGTIEFDRLLEKISEYVFEKHIDCKVRINEVAKFRQQHIFPRDFKIMGDLSYLNISIPEESYVTVYNEYFNATVHKYSTESTLWFSEWEFKQFIINIQMYTIPISILLYFGLLFYKEKK